MMERGVSGVYYIVSGIDNFTGCCPFLLSSRLFPRASQDPGQCIAATCFESGFLEWLDKLMEHNTSKGYK